MGSAYFDAHSLWQANDKPHFTTLSEDLTVDTVIVGGGIAGLTTAYLLTKAGQKVVVLDKERLGLGETGLTSAHISNVFGDRYFDLIKLHGLEGAKMAASSHRAGIELIDRIQREENIECEFKRTDGYLFLDETHDIQHLKKELKAVHEIGWTDVRLLPSAPVALFNTGPCLYFPKQAQFSPMKYIDGLSHAITRLGAQIFTHSEVVEIKGGADAYVKTTQGFKVHAAHIVVATNVPINNIVSIVTKNAAYRTYVVGLPIPKEKVQDILLWDTKDPYHYIRFVKDPLTGEDILLVGGEDHRTGQDTDTEVHFENLHRWIEDKFDIHGRITTRWSGQIMEPVDGMAYIGRNPGDQNNVFIITGDAGNGLTHGSLGGILLSDLIQGIDNPWSKLYDPSRLHARSLGTFVSEATQSSLPYGDWLMGGDVSSTDEIKAGEGAILRDGLSKIAVYKDESNRLHCTSAVCPHLGGLVRWNPAEKSWDCPCHGSRFDRFGEVVNGPAPHGLKPIADPRVTAEELDLDGINA